MNATIQALSQFRLFSALDQEARRDIAFYVHERTYEPGRVIVFSGEPCEAVYFVVRGLARARRLSMEGREYVLAYIGAGEAFNLIPALDGGTNPVTVEALTETTLYLLPCDHFQRIVQQHHEVAMAALVRLSERVRYLSDRVEDLALHTVRTRLARFLLSRADGVHWPRHWTQEEIAAHIGTVRDVVGRALRSFAREGLVRRERGRVVVQDIAALRHEAMQE